MAFLSNMQKKKKMDSFSDPTRVVKFNQHPNKIVNHLLGNYPVFFEENNTKRNKKRKVLPRDLYFDGSVNYGAGLVRKINKRQTPDYYSYEPMGSQHSSPAGYRGVIHDPINQVYDQTTVHSDSTHALGAPESQPGKYTSSWLMK